MPQTGVHEASQKIIQDSAMQNGSGTMASAVVEADAPAPAVALDSSPDSEVMALKDAVDNGVLSDELIADDGLADSVALAKGANAETSENGVIDSSAPSDATLEIDQRRAKQLLDRAILLSERGDLAGAILASRQAVSLAPHEASGHSMLGLLHERAGDLEKAIASYEKVLELAPNSSLERDSLDRLKATLESENASVVFHFDDNELFEEPPALATPAAATTRDTLQTEPAASVTPVVAAAAATVAAPQSALPAPAATVAATTPKSAAQLLDDLQLGVATPARVAPARPDLGPLTMPSTARRPSLGLLLRQPSFYFRGAPIVAATTLGLLFMGWAEGVSQNKYMTETLPGAATPTTVVKTTPREPGTSVSEPAQGGQPAGGSTVVTPAQGTVPVGGGIFGQGNTSSTSSGSSSGRTPGAAPAAPAGRSNTASIPPGSSVPAPSGPSASSGTQQLPPMIPQPNGSTGGSGGAGGGSSSPAGGSGTLNSLPPFRPRGAPQEIVRPTAPPAGQGSASGSSVADNGGASTGGNSTQGGMFNPATSPRGYIRIDPVRPVNPVTPVARPGNEARAAENAASRAAATGRGNDVVPSLNRSIERQPTAYAYQRRAMAFMEQGDNSRAADDFQSAIAAYQDQIRRGENVEDARNGLSTCRSGLRAVLANMGR